MLQLWVGINLSKRISQDFMLFTKVTRRIISTLNFNFWPFIWQKNTSAILHTIFIRRIWWHKQFNKNQITVAIWTQKQFISLLMCPQGSKGCQKMPQNPLNLNLEVWCANMEPKLHNLWKTVKKTWFFDDFFFNFDSFLKIMQFRLHISAPNLQIQI